MKKLIPILLIPAVMILIVLYGTRNLDAGQTEQARDRMEHSLRQAIAAEYAVSGAYPESLASITQKYGITIDTDRYAVFYTPIAENIPPDLTIVELGGEGG